MTDRALPTCLVWIEKVLDRHYFFKKRQQRASLVAQWLRIRLPMQGTRLRALAQEDPTHHGATKPVCHNY